MQKIKSKEAILIILGEDASQNTKEKIERIAKEYQIELIYYGNKEKLSNAIGKSDKVVLVITDVGFANRIMQIMKESKGAY